MATVDVVVPCYRYARFLEQCVESVLLQEGVAVRVLILDDASPDETPEVGTRLARNDTRVLYVRHAENKGHISTYNSGIEWISADYYLLLSADDYLVPGALARAAAVLDSNPNVSFVFGDATVAHPDGSREAQLPFGNKESDASIRIMDTTEFITASQARNIVPTPTAVVRTSLQKKCGGYRKDLPHAGDMDMWFRLAALGDVGFVKAEQAVYRRHDANMSLTYSGTFKCADVQQRLAVLTAFFGESSACIDDSHRLRVNSMRLLAQDALLYAHDAFNNGHTALSAQLCELSLAIHPGSNWSPLRWKLTAKSLLGPEAWRLVSRLRRRTG